MARDEISRNLSIINDEISKINASLKTATKETNSLAKQMRLDPKNVQLAATYADSLAKKLELARQKTDLLQKKQAEMAKTNSTAKTTKEYDDLTKQIIKAESEVRVLNRQIAETNNTKLTKLQNGLAGVSKLCTAILGSVVAIGIAFAKTGDEIDKNSKKFGVSAETYQKFANIFNNATGSSTSYVSTLQQMAQLMGQIEKGSGKMFTTLELMGVSMEELKGKGPQELLEFILDLLSSIDDQEDRLATASAIFGTYGTDIATVAALTAGEVSDLNAQLERAGIVTGEQAAKAAALNDAFTDLQNTFKAALVGVGEQLVPVFMSLINLLKAFIPVLSVVANFLNFIGPAGMSILMVIMAVVAILPALAGLLKAINIIAATLNITVGALLAKLMVIMGVVIAIGLLLNAIFSKSYSLDVDTSSADGLLDQANATIYGNGVGAETGGGTTNVTYNDYSTTNVTAETEVDLDEIIEGLNSKVIQVGGR